MAAPTTTSTSATDTTDLAQRIREQFVTAVQEAQQRTVDATASLVKTMSALPVRDLPAIPGVANLPSAEVATTYAFDFASDLLKSQRDFSLKMAGVLVPHTAA